MRAVSISRRLTLGPRAARPAGRVAELLVHSLADLPTAPAARASFRRVTLLDPRAALEPEDALERAVGLVRPGGVVVVAPRRLHAFGDSDALLERVRGYAAWLGLADACVVGRAVVARREA